jgi:catechol 2,3-dioxygenase-like lactoylglutathione lyase family enzyme
MKIFLAALLLAGTAVRAELPEMYKSVDHVIWVVKDLDKVVEGWTKLGFEGIVRHDGVSFAGEYRGKPISVQANVAIAQLANLQVDWVQPSGDGNAYSDFLARHGDGIISLVHSAPSLAALDAEVDRLRSLGVGVLQRVKAEGAGGQITLVHMDTAEQGKYSLGLIYDPAPEHSAASGRAVSQYAFVARETRAVSAYWAKLGFPEMTYTHGSLSNLRYRGKPGTFDQELGWQRHGKVVYEWIWPLKGPTVYEEHLKAHGEGFHHLGINVEDMDRGIAEWTKAGFAVSQSGGWGEEGKQGSGRFAYIDTDSIGGVTVELLWSYRPPR